VKVGDPNGYTKENRHEHYLTIIDNMVSLSLMQYTYGNLISIDEPRHDV